MEWDDDLGMNVPRFGHLGFDRFVIVSSSTTNLKVLHRLAMAASSCLTKYMDRQTGTQRQPFRSMPRNESLWEDGFRWAQVVEW